MDKKKSILNVSVSTIFRLCTIVMSVFVRRVLINTCGNEVNGLNSLYLSIVGFLTVAELGVGSAITFCMYKPIVEKDDDQVSALYHLFRRVYYVIGGVVLGGGLLLTPFIHYFAKDYQAIDVNLYSTFVLMLISSAITYFFGAKTALINAYKNNYITTAITSGGILLQYVLQILALKLTGSFSWYLASRIVAAAAQWIVTEWITRKKYLPILRNHQKIAGETKSRLMQNIKAMFMHKIGKLLVNTADSVIISAFVGVVALGAYTNYTAIMNSMTDVLKLIFVSLTSVFGHLYASESKEVTKKYCDAFHFLNFVIGVVFFMGYYGIIDNLIAILFSKDLVVDKSLSYVITVNGFVQYMRESTLVFRDATGAFYNDRWKPLVEGAVNIVLSILLVKWIGTVGVIAATVVTNLLICHVVEPYVLYKDALEVSPVPYYLKNYGMIALFFAGLWLFDKCMIGNAYNQWLQLLVNGCISVGFSLGICFLAAIVNVDVLKDIWKLRKEKQNQ